MYTLKIKIHCIERTVLFIRLNSMTNIFCIISFSNKTQAFTLCHNYCTVLHEMHSGALVQQIRKIKGFEYFQHINYSTHHKCLHVVFTGSFE